MDIEVPFSPFFEGLIRAVKGGDDQEGALIEIHLLGDRLVLRTEGTDVAAEVVVPVLRGRGPVQAWRLPAHLVRDALRRGSMQAHDGGDARLHISADGEAEYTHLSFQADPLGNQVRSVPGQRIDTLTQPVQQTDVTYRFFPRDLLDIAEFAGDRGAVTLDAAHGIIHGTDRDGNTAAVPMRDAGLRAVTTPMDRIRGPAPHVREEIEGLQRFRTKVSSLFQEEDVPVPDYVRAALAEIEHQDAIVLERLKELRAEEDARNTELPGVRISGLVAKRVAYAMQARFAETKAEQRADTRARRRRGEAIERRDQIRELSEQLPALSISKEDAEGARRFSVDATSFVAPADSVESVEVADLKDGIRVALADLRPALDWLQEAVITRHATGVPDLMPTANITFWGDAEGRLSAVALRPRYERDAAGTESFRVDLNAQCPPGFFATLPAECLLRVAGVPKILQIQKESDSVTNVSAAGFTYRLRHVPVDALGDAWGASTSQAYTAAVLQAADSLKYDRDGEIAEIMAEDTGRGAAPEMHGRQHQARATRRGGSAQSAIARFLAVAHDPRAEDIGGDELERLGSLASDGNVEARDRLITAYLPFAFTVARRGPSLIPLEDRLSVALLALTRAAASWKPDREASFPRYISIVFRNTLSRELPAIGGYQLSFGEGTVLREVGRVRDMLRDTSGAYPSAQAVADTLAEGVTDPDERLTILRRTECVVGAIESAFAPSIDHSIGDRTLGEFIASPNTAPEADSTKRRAIRSLGGLPLGSRDAASALGGAGGTFAISGPEYAVYSGVTVSTIENRLGEAGDALRESEARLGPKRAVKF